MEAMYLSIWYHFYCVCGKRRLENRETIMSDLKLKNPRVPSTSHTYRVNQRKKWHVKMALRLEIVYLCMWYHFCCVCVCVCGKTRVETKGLCWWCRDKGKVLYQCEIMNCDTESIVCRVWSKKHGQKRSKVPWVNLFVRNMPNDDGS